MEIWIVMHNGHFLGAFTNLELVKESVEKRDHFNGNSGNKFHLAPEGDAYWLDGTVAFTTIVHDKSKTIVS